MKKQSEGATGLTFGVSAYLIWGSFPLIITAASFANPFEVVVWRVVFGFLFAALLVTLTRTWAQTVELVRSPKKLGWVAVASLFIFVNWSVYVVAVATSNVLETSLGYFINPLITVLFAVVFLKEKLRKGQWVALGIGLIAVVILTFDYGRPPWIALVLAISFATYSLAKNRVGGKIKALQSFTIESGIVLPFVLVQLWIVSMFTPIMIFSGVVEASILISFGILTAIPLILFGAAASRVKLSTIGFIQYLTPILQFSVGYFILEEPMPPVRWIGFALVWVSLVVLTTDALRRRKPDLPIAVQG
ncbi:MAG: EamA family transporter RarD [Actinobacteria bacterium]|uniref:EamA family transporter RarD n=2 Tax=Aquiluna sp. TaxID=2053504 RepID=UPI002324F353|nr:EamA family transporter RarD [Actinomycetota bacterium]MDA8796588.1 EamA family transporter RarD [Aquiluna sp.]MDA2976343.1 EamA family transporter RarD [Actinomycetota bacterium]MDA9796563.1 EamA family transporter RarD [Aquiluna sp.]NCW23530.1 EamA family transporter RarD [Actinomycetota bacterium]